jgi:hypothetical protein
LLVLARSSLALLKMQNFELAKNRRNSWFALRAFSKTAQRAP